MDEKQEKSRLEMLKIIKDFIISSYSKNKKLVTLTAIFLSAYFIYLFLNLYFYGTLKFGKYYIHTWAPPPLNEMLFHIGKSTYPEVVDKLIKESSECKSKCLMLNEDIKNKENAKSNEINQVKNEGTIIEYPSININLNNNSWIRDSTLEPKEIRFERVFGRNHCELSGPVGLIELNTDLDCSLVTPSQIAQELDKQVSVSIQFYDFCRYFEDKFLTDNRLIYLDLWPKGYDSCEQFDVTEFSIYKDVFLPEQIWPKIPSCQPSGALENKFKSEPITILGITGIKQKSKMICAYEGGSLRSFMNIYLPLKDKYKGILMYISISYLEESQLGPQAEKEFEQALINSLEIK